MLTPVPPSDCSRAREAVSGRLDGELSEIDAVWLEGHLRGCAACREFSTDAAALTAELRAASLELPVIPSFALTRRRARTKRAQGALAAAVAVLVAASAAIGRVHATDQGPVRTPVAVQSVSGGATLPRRDGIEERVLAMLPASDRWFAELQSLQTPAL